jgi:hypothetical protein
VLALAKAEGVVEQLLLELRHLRANVAVYALAVVTAVVVSAMKMMCGRI